MLTHIIARTLVFDPAGRTLVLTRSLDDDYRPGGCDFPGGKLDDGEAILTGAVRELSEETGLQVKESALQLVMADTKAAYSNGAQADINHVKLIFVVGVGPEKVVVSDEHSSYSWLTLDEAIQTFGGYPAGVKVLHHLRDNRVATELWDKHV